MNASTTTCVHASVRGEDAVLEARDFGLWYGGARALAEISMPIPRGKVTALIGPSGCGKSALLRSINRMIDLVDGMRVEGELLFDGASIYASKVDVLALRKRMGMVFRAPNPFPMSIYENVVFPLRSAGERRKEVLDEACERALRSVALWDEVQDRLDQGASSLSDANQQLLCVARAIAARPEVLLLDEPCFTLDPIATAKIEAVVDGLRGQSTVLIVTHNVQQAARASDFTAFMDRGRVIEYGASEEIFTKPSLRSTEDYITGRFH